MCVCVCACVRERERERDRERESKSLCECFFYPLKFQGDESVHDVVANVDCNIVVNEFNLQSSDYVHFQTNTQGKDL